MSDTNDTDRHKRGGNTKTPLKSRKWCFTINNYTEDMIDTLTQQFLKKNFQYIFGKEVAPTTFTRHLQGFLESKNAIRFNTLKDLMPTAHLEVAKGSAKQNYNYCSKEDEYFTNIIGCISQNKKNEQTLTDIFSKVNINFKDHYPDHWQWQPEKTIWDPENVRPDVEF